jgi:purine-binding chemotaxis protein CheW
MDELTLDILRKRAEQLATPAPKKDFSTTSQEFLVFTLGNAEYGLPALNVVKVLNRKTIYPVPGVPPFIVGLINDGGKIFSVNDVHQLFGLEKAANVKDTAIIVLSDGVLSFGILVDSVLGLRTLHEEQIDSHFFSEQQTIHFSGITADNIIILNLKEILNNRELIVNQTLNA